MINYRIAPTYYLETIDPVNDDDVVGKLIELGNEFKNCLYEPKFTKLKEKIYSIYSIDNKPLAVFSRELGINGYNNNRLAYATLDMVIGILNKEYDITTAELIILSITAGFTYFENMPEGLETCFNGLLTRTADGYRISPLILFRDLAKSNKPLEYDGFENIHSTRNNNISKRMFYGVTQYLNKVMDPDDTEYNTLPTDEEHSYRLERYKQHGTYVFRSKVAILECDGGNSDIHSTVEGLVSIFLSSNDSNINVHTHALNTHTVHIMGSNSEVSTSTEIVIVYGDHNTVILGGFVRKLIVLGEDNIIDTSGVSVHLHIEIASGYSMFIYQDITEEHVYELGYEVSYEDAGKFLMKTNFSLRSLLT